MCVGVRSSYVALTRGRDVMLTSVEVPVGRNV
jgi:hypothetical protein